MRSTVSKIVLAALAGLLIASCGGGGGNGGGEVASAPSPLASVQARRPGAQDPTLVASPVSVVNSTTAGQQVLRAIGATSDGGYTVAWLSGDATLYAQHYDSRGEKDGPQTLIALVNPRTNAAADSQVISSSALAVLADGSIVVAYVDSRPTPGPEGEIYRSGIFLQRFDAQGARILPEIRVSSQQGSPPPSRANVLGYLQVIPLSDGGFVVGWTIWFYALMPGTRYSLWLQRFDAQAQPVGALVHAGDFYDLTYVLAADRAGGGFTVKTSSFDSSGRTVSSSTHFDAAMVAGPGSSGPLELADGTYVVVTQTGNTTFTLQRFSANGAPLGSPIVLEITPPPYQTASFQITALADPGFALAWTGQGTGGDSDVFTQAFVESENDRKKACREAAKARKLKGKQRQAFIADCVA